MLSQQIEVSYDNITAVNDESRAIAPRNWPHQKEGEIIRGWLGSRSRDHL